MRDHLGREIFQRVVEIALNGGRTMELKDADWFLQALKDTGWFLQAVSRTHQRLLGYRPLLRTLATTTWLRSISYFRVPHTLVT
jgi:hypothetical protein